LANNLNSLLTRVEKADPALAGELRKQFEAFSRLREFGLNFEKHRPETVELHGRRVRVGDKVRFLSPRGSTRSARKDTWVVLSLGKAEGAPVASLRHEDGDEEATRSVDDLVVIADFRDPIYPGLVSAGRIERGGDKPFHAVINSENYHALEALLFAYEGKVDAIYIDPPYNTRDKDWKYNNDYVDPGDSYAHSKWLSMMERRLKLAMKLLNPACSTLIVTIDEKEYLRLGLLLEQTFLGAHIQMVTSVISAKGAVRPGRFSRVEEYIFIVSLGEARIDPWTLNMLDEGEGDDEGSDEGQEPANVERPIEWLGLRRREPSSPRGSRKNQFYPILVNAEDGTLHSIGDPVKDDVNRHKVSVPSGTVAL